MKSELDEHERVMELEMGYQRRQWDKLLKLEKLVGEQATKVQELERSLQEQMDRNRSMDKQAELDRREVQSARAGLVERCNEERDARKKELQSLRASLTEITHSHQKGQQELRSSCDAVQRQLDDLALDLGSKYKDLQRLLREECAELVRGCTARCTDLGRDFAEERGTRQKELQGLRASIKALEGDFDDRLRETLRDLTHSHQKGQQDLRACCDALAQDLGGKCKDLERLFGEECAHLVRGCVGQCADLGREFAEERDARQKELQGLRASIKGLEGACEAARELVDAHQKGQQELRFCCDAVQRQHDDLAQDLGGKCRDLERLFKEECAELVRGCTGHCADLGRDFAEERDTRQKELQGLRASIKALEGHLDDQLRGAVRDLADSHEKEQQRLLSSCTAVQRQHEDLVQDLGSRCKDLERLFKEECAEVGRGFAARCAELGREAAEERDARRTSIKDLEAKLDGTLREAVRTLTDSHQRGHQELRSSCDAVQQQQKELEHVFSEELRGSVSVLERRSHEIIRETTKELSSLMHSKHSELVVRIKDVEHNLTSHTHKFTSKHIYHSGTVLAPSAVSPTEGSKV